MCGIIGYIGNKKKCTYIVELLKKLEYRGYDSAGISIVTNNSQQIFKATGQICELEKNLPKKLITKNAIAHTRWATHGKVSTINCHPHQSKNKKWTIVHNGIIENCTQLKKNYNLSTTGETDTEILINYIAKQSPKNIYDFVHLFKNVNGSYAIICQRKNSPNKMFIAKKNSPLYIAENNKSYLIASDPLCFQNFSKKYFALNDNEFAYIKNKKIYFFNKFCKKIIKSSTNLNLYSPFFSTTKNNCEHFMLKEIFEQPSSLQRQISEFKTTNILKRFSPKFLSNFQYVKLIGCGSAFHACLIGAKYFEKILHFPASAEIASEFIYNNNVLNHNKTLFVFVSQSGETADTLHALQLEKNLGATCIAITNVEYSTLAQMADFTIPLFAGPEIAVASTKAYTCQISALYLFVNSLNNNFPFDEIKELSCNILSFNKHQIDNISSFMAEKEKAIFIGKDLDYITAMESSLKLKEISYINSSANPSGELKHGYLALIEKDTPLIVIATNPLINNKTFNSASEAVTRGAKEILITNENIKRNFSIQIKNHNPLLAPILSIAPLQYLSYKVSLYKNINPDKPRNLAKSVTVE